MAKSVNERNAKPASKNPCSDRMRSSAGGGVAITGVLESSAQGGLDATSESFTICGVPVLGRKRERIKGTIRRRTKSSTSLWVKFTFVLVLAAIPISTLLHRSGISLHNDIEPDPSASARGFEGVASAATAATTGSSEWVTLELLKLAENITPLRPFCVYTPMQHGDSMIGKDLRRETPILDEIIKKMNRVVGSNGNLIEDEIKVSLAILTKKFDDGFLWNFVHLDSEKRDDFVTKDLWAVADDWDKAVAQFKQLCRKRTKTVA